MGLVQPASTRSTGARSTSYATFDPSTTPSTPSALTCFLPSTRLSMSQGTTSPSLRPVVDTYDRLGRADLRPDPRPTSPRSSLRSPFDPSHPAARRSHPARQSFDPLWPTTSSYWTCRFDPLRPGTHNDNRLRPAATTSWPP